MAMLQEQPFTLVNKDQKTLEVSPRTIRSEEEKFSISLGATKSKIILKFPVTVRVIDCMTPALMTFACGIDLEEVAPGISTRTFQRHSSDFHGTHVLFE